MSLPEKDRTERDAQALGDLLRAASESSEAARRTSMPARRADLAARQKLVAALPAPGGRRTTWMLSLAFSAVLACALLFFLRDRKLGYTVDGGDEGGYVRADAHSTVVRFEEGSTFSFAAGSAGRVNDVSAQGASVVLEDGSLEASVVHRSGGRWSALAGPWEVRVTGTRFDLAWDPRQRTLRVDLIDGKVVVVGPGAADGIGLHAGQTLRAREGEGIHVSSIERAATAPTHPETSARPTPAASAAVAPDAPAPSATPADPGSASAKPEAPASPDKPRTSWTELVAKGKHDVVLAEARERGIPSVLGSGSAAELLALADAARYGGDASTASRALQALRDRFAGTKAATDAAFLLGRMADDGGSPAGAIRWYDAHIAEGGAFAAEALGRKMLAVRRSSGDGAARAVAKQYLDRYPKGPHAAVARALIGGDVVDPSAPPR